MKTKYKNPKLYKALVKDQNIYIDKNTSREELEEFINSLYPKRMESIYLNLSFQSLKNDSLILRPWATISPADIYQNKSFWIDNKPIYRQYGVRIILNVSKYLEYYKLFKMPLGEYLINHVPELIPDVE